MTYNPLDYGDGQFLTYWFDNEKLYLYPSDMMSNIKNFFKKVDPVLSGKNVIECRKIDHDIILSLFKKLENKHWKIGVVDESTFKFPEYTQKHYYHEPLLLSNQTKIDLVDNIEESINSLNVLVTKIKNSTSLTTDDVDDLIEAVSNLGRIEIHSMMEEDLQDMFYEHDKNENDFESEENPRMYVVGYHCCAPSPIGKCVYNGEIDGLNDSCIYCHEPDERK